MPEAPAPAVDGWFTTDAEPRLIGARCPACGTYAFPPEVFACPNPRCESEAALERTPLSPRGRIWSFVVNHYAAPPPALSPDPFEPYAVAAVELADERLVILGRVAEGVSFDGLKVGIEMAIVVEPIILGSLELVWKWKPVTA